MNNSTHIEHRAYDITQVLHSNVTYWEQPYSLPVRCYYEFNDYWNASIEASLCINFKTYIPPICTILGSIGNILAFLVLTRKGMRQSSICFYMAVFSVMNTIVLCIGCGLNWITEITDRSYLWTLADWICKLWQFIYNVVLYSVTWLVVAMVMDRFLAIWYPSKASTFCSVFTAKVVTIIIFVGLVVISIHAMWTYELLQHGTASECSVDPQNKDFHSVAWPWISASLYTYVPCLILLIFSVLLIIGLIAYGTSSSRELPDQLSRLTLLVSLTFLLLTLPTTIVNIIEYCWPLLICNYKSQAQIYLVLCVCQSLMCVNHGTGFLLLICAMPKFRSELWSLLKRLKRNRSKRGSDPSGVEVNGDLLLKSDSMTQGTTV